MIAKVRIAPVEKWCEQQLIHLAANPLCAKLPGLEIEIVTETMQQNGAGRHWELSRESYLKLCELAEEGGPQFRTGTICEHMLEMD